MSRRRSTSRTTWLARAGASSATRHRRSCRDKWNMSVRQPIGVVGAITPWNFPVAIPSWKMIPALVCGNTVVLKPATDTPALAERFVELLAESGIPNGVVNIVHGGGGVVGERMVRHPGRARDHAHGLPRDRRRGAEVGGRDTHARPPRARRQERDHRARRRRPRARGRRDPLVGVRHLGAALHRRVARDRPAGRVRRAPVAPRRARREAAARPRLGGRHRHRPA